MKIMKFGGSSVADYPQMVKVFDILNNTQGKKIVVLSACKGITDKLEQAAILATEKTTNHSVNKNSILKSIENHHINILKSVLQKCLSPAIEAVNNLFKELQNILEGISFLNELTDATRDSVLAFGELLSTTIFHFLCKEKGIENALWDARNLIYTDNNYNNATPIIKLCDENITKEYEKINADLVIIQGFIGSYNDGIIRKTTTLGRGGSDYSASIIGSILNAEEIQIWTDVDGVLSADPRLYNNAFTIKQMTFEEIKDLSFWGAKVLHPKTIQPAIEKNINIKVLNTFNPSNHGTLITANFSNKNFVINSVVAKENCILNIASKNISSDFSNDILYSNYCNKTFINLLDGKNISEKIANNSLNFPCSVICICGSNLGNNYALFSNFLSKLNFLEDVDILQIIFGFSFNSVLLVVGKCDIHKVVSEIHKVMLK